MKILKITAKGLPLFDSTKEVCFEFHARQRVDENDKGQLYKLNDTRDFFLNPANAIVGINASGKTSALKVILLALEILNNESINHIKNNDILRDCNEAVITTFFYSNNELGKLETVICVEHRGEGEVYYYIKAENLWIKPISRAKTKSSLIEFSDTDLFMSRNNNEEFLSNDVSIIIAYNKKNNEHIYIADLLSFTNLNFLSVSGTIPTQIIAFLDPTIEHLSMTRENGKFKINLKFKDKDEIVLSDPIELNQYLSSGTVKGIITFSLAIRTLAEGGYMIVDEIENHFNREIVSTLIRFFNDSLLNKNGGTLIFSTHYSELLDEFDRNDCIFITRNRNGISVENLKDILKRNDINKSEAFKSGYLDGTVPSYEAYIRLKKSISSILERGDKINE